jgi:hypothetical protein
MNLLKRLACRVVGHRWIAEPDPDLRVLLVPELKPWDTPARCAVCGERDDGMLVRCPPAGERPT